MRIDEIFGPTIAGEGSIAGAVTMFIRTGGCDYRCAWCDTLHAVEASNAPRWDDMTPASAADRMEALAPDLAPGTWISVSGGNPAIWQNELPELVAELQARGYRVNIETQGSVPNEAFRTADLITLSPKGPSSGMVLDRAKLAVCMLQAQARAVLRACPFACVVPHRLHAQAAHGVRVVLVQRQDVDVQHRQQREGMRPGLRVDLRVQVRRCRHRQRGHGVPTDGLGALTREIASHRYLDAATRSLRSRTPGIASASLRARAIPSSAV